MLRLFSRTTGESRNSRGRRNNPGRKRPLLLENLEERTVFSGSPLAADADQSLTTPTEWNWYQNVSSTTVSQKLTENGGRLIDLEVESAAPLRFTVSMVKNTGDYQKQWWWYFGQTKSGLQDKLDLHNARIQDLEVYSVNGEQRYAAILVPNTGEQAKQWWWYHNINSTELKNNLTTHGARLIDLDTRVVNNVRVYDAVMVKNTGVDAKSWWYYHNKSSSEVATLLNQNRARLVDIEDRTNGRFDVIMVRSTDTWWWYHDVSGTQLKDLYGRNGARIIDVERYQVNGSTRYSVALINNSNSLTTQVGASLRDSTPTGHVGAYLKEVGGPVLASLQADRQFEPASMIKVLSHLHAMRRLQAGDPAANLNKLYDFYFKPGDNINNNLKGDPDVNPDSYMHTTANRITENLGKILERMMERSDNRATLTVFDAFGEAAINATAQLVGMTNTAYTSTIGSGVPGNFLTLADAGKLYEKVLNGTLLGTGTTAQNEFFRRMIDQDASDTEQFDNGDDGISQAVRDIVLTEAGLRLALPKTNASVIGLANDFISKMRRGAKGGSYTLNHSDTEWKQVRTTGGWIELPTAGGSSSKRYVYGAFVEDAITPRSPAENPALAKVDSAIRNATNVLFRDVIRKALATWSV